MQAVLARCVYLVLLIALPQALFAATITVTGTGSVVADDGVCSLREAITSANTNTASGALAGECPAGGASGDIIQLTVDVVLTEVDSDNVGPNGLPTISSAILIQGNGHSVRRDSTAPDFRFFYVSSSLKLENTTLSNGRQNSGGAIFTNGSLTLSNSTLSGNRSTPSSGGAIYVIGNGSVTLTDSVLSGNSAMNGGGAIFSFQRAVYIRSSILSGNQSQFGGAISLEGGLLQIDQSTLSDNSANVNGGAINGRSTGPITIENSTISGNQAANSGGGIYLLDAGSASVGNSTFSHNSAGISGGAIYYNFTPFFNLRLSTLAGNSTDGDGAGIAFGGSGSFLNAVDSILANSAGGANCFGSITSSGGNLADDTSCILIPGTLTGLEMTLADNGGPTRTHALLSGSNAINNASPNLSYPGDQRGATREDGYDSGAFEFRACPDLVFSGTTLAGVLNTQNCQKIQLGPDYTVAETGALTLRAGKSIAVVSGLTVASGGTMALTVDGGLQATKRVFVTSLGYTGGEIGGLSGADAICQSHADAASLPGTFKAWLSDSSSGPEDNFSRAGLPYLRVDEVRVADSWKDLTDGSNLQATINLDENGDNATVVVWTSTLTDGSKNPANANCTNWTSNAGQGSYGVSFQAIFTWTDALDENSCDNVQALYCFEQ